MNPSHHIEKEVYLNSRTLQQPRRHSWQLSCWLIDKIDTQYKQLGIKFIPIPWTINKD